MKKLMLLLLVAVCASSIGYGMKKEEKKDLTEVHLNNLKLFLETAKEKNEKLKNVDIYYNTLVEYLKKYNSDSKSKNSLNELFLVNFHFSAGEDSTYQHNSLYYIFIEKKEKKDFNDIFLESLNDFLVYTFNQPNIKENKKIEKRKLEDEEADELIKLNEELLKKKNEEENKKLKENENLKKNVELLKQQTELKKKKEEEKKEYIETILAQKKWVGIGSFFLNFTASSLARYYEVTAQKQTLWFFGSNLVLHLINLKKYQNIAKLDEKYKIPLSTSPHAVDVITGTFGYASGNFITNKIIALKKFGDMAFKKYNY